MISIYNEEAVRDEREVHEKTINFINDRLSLISSELGELETGTEEFKIKNKVTDITSEANIYLDNVSNYENST